MTATDDGSVDGAGLGVLRALFGAVMLLSVVRFVARGWVGGLLTDPGYHFAYVSWIRPLPAPLMLGSFAVMAAAALGVLVGAATRASAAVFFVTFTYAELIDKATYLNHYYLVSLIALLLVLVPAGADLSIDAWRRGARRVSPRVYTLLRAQIALVYLFAGLAKLDGDWLLRAEPMRGWLLAHADAPLIGPLLARPWVAFAMSWAGALFDLTIWAWLLWPRTRRAAYAVAVVFHVAVWLLFPIGVFSWLMLALTTIFFAPDWPRRWLRRCAPHAPPRPWPRTATIAAALWLGVQVAVPLRFLARPGPVNWTEDGFRFSWRVMLIEKTGSVEYQVVAGSPPRRWLVHPRRELTPLQYRMMSTQPDMIRDYARHLAGRYPAPVHVYAHAWASLNGRPAAPLVDPSDDLAD